MFRLSMVCPAVEENGAEPASTGKFPGQPDQLREVPVLNPNSPDEAAILSAVTTIEG